MSALLKSGGTRCKCLKSSPQPRQHSSGHGMSRIWAPLTSIDLSITLQQTIRALGDRCGTRTCPEPHAASCPPAQRSQDRVIVAQDASNRHLGCGGREKAEGRGLWFPPRPGEALSVWQGAGQGRLRAGQVIPSARGVGVAAYPRAAAGGGRWQCPPTPLLEGDKACSPAPTPQGGGGEEQRHRVCLQVSLQDSRHPKPVGCAECRHVLLPLLLSCRRCSRSVRCAHCMGHPGCRSNGLVCCRVAYCCLLAAGRAPCPALRAVTTQACASLPPWHAAQKQAQHLDNTKREIKILTRLRGTLRCIGGGA